LGFPLAKVFVHALNANMNQDAPPTAVNQTGDGLNSKGVRYRAWRYHLFFGATAGVMVGVVDFAASLNGSQLDEGFALLDLPIRLLMGAVEDRVDFPPWIWAYPYCFGLLVDICYWTAIGLFSASLLCLARDRKCRINLLFGACGGIVIGCLDFLVRALYWYGLYRHIDFFDRPARPLVKAEYQIIREAYPGVVFPYWRLTYVVYWLAVGLLLALFFWAVRILRKRKAAREPRSPL
jgi:hypothetical protein